jgi:tetratricopeptide (TPR) repeat protein
MAGLRKFAGFFFILVLLCILQACAEVKQPPPPTPEPAPQPAPQPAPPAQPAPQPSAPVRPPAAATGDYQKTIEFYKSAYRRRPHDQALVREYVKSLKEIKTAADKASLREDFAYAGKTYNLLLKNYPDFKTFSHILSFDRGQLNIKVTNCKTILYTRGFQEYRAGRLNEAILFWQDYLALDPQNPDIRKALNTAKTQQKNLEHPK